MSHDRDRFGSVVGILTFLGGIALLAGTFAWAYGLFSLPPEQAIGIRQGKTLDLNEAGRSGMVLLFRLALLLTMCFVGSVIANRGIKLYHASRATHLKPPEPQAEPERLE